MKINEVISESKVSEVAPAGMFSQMGQKILGKLGSVKGQAGAEVGDRANQIYKAFTKYALRAGIDPKATPISELESWFASQGLSFPHNAVGSEVEMFDLTDKDTSKLLWTAAAQQAYKGGTQPGVKLGQQYGVKGQPQSRPGLSSTNVDTEAGTANFERIKRAIPSMSPKQKWELGQMLMDIQR